MSRLRPDLSMPRGSGSAGHWGGTSFGSSRRAMAMESCRRRLLMARRAAVRLAMDGDGMMMMTLPKRGQRDDAAYQVKCAGRENVPANDEVAMGARKSGA